MEWPELFQVAEKPLQPPNLTAGKAQWASQKQESHIMDVQTNKSAANAATKLSEECFQHLVAMKNIALWEAKWAPARCAPSSEVNEE